MRLAASASNHLQDPKLPMKAYCHRRGSVQLAFRRRVPCIWRAILAMTDAAYFSCALVIVGVFRRLLVILIAVEEVSQTRKTC